jgi:hypothetical protein
LLDLGSKLELGLPLDGNLSGGRREVNGREVLLLLMDVFVHVVLILSVCVAELVSVLLFRSVRVLLHHALGRISSLEDSGLKVSYL